MRQTLRVNATLRQRATRFGLGVALLGATSLAASGGGWATEGLSRSGPFAAPAAFVPTESQGVHGSDVTGTIPTAAGLTPDAALAPPQGIPELGIAPPALPQPVLTEGTPSVLTVQDMALALADWREATALPLGTAPSEQGKQRQAVRDGIVAYYAAHGNAALWLDGARFSAAARTAMSRIERAAEDGLNLRTMVVPVLRDPDARQLAAADLALSEAVVAYARQAGGSRIDPLQINRLITAKRTIPEPAEILATVLSAPDAGAALRSYNPPQPGYAALRAKLAELRQAAPVARQGIPLGPTLKLGMRDARVPLIRSRFGLDAAVADPSGEPLVYDIKVADAVADYQRGHGLPASGTLTPRTVTMLSGGDPARLENELVANMERWRWLPRDLGPDHITVNVPDYSLDLVRNNISTHHARVVVGKPDHQTPIFSDAMRFIIVNPYWNVPLSIIKKEMLPKLAQDPNYFANHGYEVVERDGVTVVRQPPGEDNALGRIKFMFPNQHAVYLHDTNARALFGKDKRAFSHGCVRVDQPFKLAEAVLGPDHGWTEKRIQKLVGGDERTINLPVPMPIHIVYFTAYVDDGGGLQLRDDLYGYSDKVKSALGLRG
ncbi:L,D-transpeptidase family protein [Lichenihabitans sp. Uapishka_5]|uniref:L,D-transpeptidase family protein n=1 Tax=Lichenihabitans sp. Uapishka_5 TaxID=3037302 RepID=UPI0029E818F4|nr:L,D-transpeptidase family protein [Lichenihabitans sp. Uapishka_5]MDX7949964.1 L,D-transpeptidase family protein [Lichenihabitans sp. Uapishka_5]